MSRGDKTITKRLPAISHNLTQFNSQVQTLFFSAEIVPVGLLVKKRVKKNKEKKKSVLELFCGIKIAEASTLGGIFSFFFFFFFPRFECEALSHIRILSECK